MDKLWKTICKNENVPRPGAKTLIGITKQIVILIATFLLTRQDCCAMVILDALKLKATRKLWQWLIVFAHPTVRNQFFRQKASKILT